MECAQGCADAGFKKRGRGRHGVHSLNVIRLKGSGLLTFAHIVAAHAAHVQGWRDGQAIFHSMWTGKIIGAVDRVDAGRTHRRHCRLHSRSFFRCQKCSASGAFCGGAAGISIQQTFFTATFEVMGHIAKADGRVSQEEIHAARAVMNDFRLNDQDVQRAIDCFTRGKSAAYPLDESLQRLRQQLGARPDLCRMFVQVQLQAALIADGLNAASRPVLQRVAQALGISDYELAHLEALLRMRQTQSEPRNSDAPNRLADAYQVLGIAQGCE